MVFSSPYAHRTRGAPQLGALLQAERKARGFTVSEAARRAGLPTRYVEALEGGADAGLPAPVYLDGILRRYARALELNPERVVDAFWQERRRVGELAGELEHDELPALPRRFRFVITPRVVTVLGGVAAFVLLSGYLWYQVSGLVAGPTLEVASPAADLTTSEPAMALTGRTEPDARLTVNSREVYVDDAGRFSVNLDLTPGLHTVEVRAVNRFGHATTVIRRIFRTGG